jgi:Zn finger protein HypA/HybF involved in hydrogenase expression
MLEKRRLMCYTLKSAPLRGFFRIKTSQRRQEKEMHELGVLSRAVSKVNGIAEQNGIERIKFMTLEVGTESTFVPVFFEKLFPLAKESYPRLRDAELKIALAPGKGLIIKEIGYEDPREKTFLRNEYGTANQQAGSRAAASHLKGGLPAERRKHRRAGKRALS